jgi:D-alanyl-lipoteichoic acid acyltransferase DltB (MBOAT superfamily)
MFGVPAAPAPQPLGISYYTFILIGFLADSARQARPLTASRLPSLLLFFPFLSSGPIVRLRSWSAQVSRGRKRRVMRNVTIGSHLFLVGAIKKILIADPIAVSTAPIWASPGEYGQAALAIAIVSFYVQLYADFSGYTDMARGVARMMGFHLPINFKAPYFAVTPTEFWGRWHMSLTGWIRDYVFTPLSVVVWRKLPYRRTAPVVTFALSVLLMTLVGLWHGASTNFVLFGVLHGVLIGIWYAAVGTGRRLTPRQRILSWALFHILLMLSMTMFRADTLGRALEVVSGALLSRGPGSVNEALIGLAIATVAIYVFQHFDIRHSRTVARMRSDVRLFPIFLVLIFFVLYMKGLTLEGVWISPGDPFFNQGQEKFIYLQF